MGGGLNSVKDIYIGNKKITKAYVGNELVYQDKIIYLIKNGVPNEKNCLKYINSKPVSWNNAWAFGGVSYGYGYAYGAINFDTTKYKAYVIGIVGLYMDQSGDGANRWSLMGTSMASSGIVLRKANYYDSPTQLAYSYVGNQYGSAVGYGAAGMINGSRNTSKIIYVYFGAGATDNLYLEKI